MIAEREINKKISYDNVVTASVVVSHALPKESGKALPLFHKMTLAYLIYIKLNQKINAFFSTQ